MSRKWSVHACPKHYNKSAASYLNQKRLRRCETYAWKLCAWHHHHPGRTRTAVTHSTGAHVGPQASTAEPTVVLGVCLQVDDASNVRRCGRTRGGGGESDEASGRRWFGTGLKVAGEAVACPTPRCRRPRQRVQVVFGRRCSWRHAPSAVGREGGHAAGVPDFGLNPVWQPTGADTPALVSGGGHTKLCAGQGRRGSRLLPQSGIKPQP